MQAVWLLLALLLPAEVYGFWGYHGAVVERAQASFSPEGPPWRYRKCLHAAVELSNMIRHPSSSYPGSERCSSRSCEHSSTCVPQLTEPYN